MDGALDLIREAAAAVTAGLGAVVLLLSALAAHRARDVYLRAHALKPALVYAAPLLFAGLAIAAWDSAASLRLALLAAASMGFGLAALIAAAAAAHEAGAAPLSREDLEEDGRPHEL